MKIADEVYIVNLYTLVTDIKRCLMPNTRHLILISTHTYFSNEKIEIQKHLKNIEVTFLRFDNWNDELENEDIDYKSYLKVKKWIQQTSIYQAQYFAEIAFLKNEFIHKKLKTQNLVDNNTNYTAFCQSYEMHNLGISYRYWKSVPAKIVNSGIEPTWRLLQKKVTSLMIIRQISYYVRAFFLALVPRRVLQLVDGEKYSLISTKRLMLKTELKTHSKWIWPIWYNFNTDYLAAPVHRSSPLLGMAPFVRREKMVIVQDAFRPTTYPPYYYAQSFIGCKKIAQDKVDFTFLSNAGLDMLPLGTVLAKKRMKEDLNIVVKEVKTVCLSLNHSGNWSSLISRCDTDGLIVLLFELSKEFEDINFIIRLHPNSDDKKAEGNGWIARVKEQVKKYNSPNVSVSNLPIEKDWERADLFISEYSLSVIDALVYGKIVLFLNTTKRVSFVRDFTDVGFVEVYSLHELSTQLQQIVADPKSAFQKLTQSSVAYNHRYVD